MGELLEAIEPATGKTKRDGDGPFSKTKAAEDAGISMRQRKTAVRVARVPEYEFTEQVESGQ